MRETRMLYSVKVRETRQLYAETRNSQHGIISVSMRELDKFVSLLSSDRIALLMERDKCYNQVDNYLLATVFVYFKRAGLRLEEFNQENFFRCLYLAHDMEEDEEELKWELLHWALGDDDSSSFFLSRDQLWRRMGYRSVVSKKQCEQVMKLPVRVNIWNRRRNTSHSGAVRRPDPQYFQALGPRGSSRQELCYRCNSDYWREAAIAEAKMSRLFVMDIMEEEETDNVLDSPDEINTNKGLFA